MREKLLVGTKVPISEHNFNLEKILCHLCENLFHFDHDDSWKILSTIAKLGPLTQTQIEKHSTLDRYTIRRRIDNENGLLTKEFLYESTGKKRYNKVQRFFGLTLKGFIASLARLKIEQNYLFKIYQNELIENTKNKVLADLAVEYIKYNLAIILYWHKANGFKLTDQTNTEYYLAYFNESNIVDKFPFYPTQIDKSSLDEFLTLRTLFLISQMTIAKILLNMKEKYTLIPFEAPLLSKKVYLYKSNTVRRSVIKDWIMSLQLVQYQYTKKIPEIIGAREIENIRVDRANRASLDLMKKLGFVVEKQPIVIL